jgi:DNA repair protein RecN (Recombination protein N)
MLNLIRIKNYAVIDEVEVEFDSGFTVMTGETGAGKSILVDALGLVLGDRADASAVRHGTDKAEISVLFDCPPEHPALEWLSEHGLDDELSCSLRRVISAEGRSRAFVNNHPVTLQDLRTLGSQLVDIHGQHAHQSLLHAREQRRLVDSSGGLTELANQVATLFASWRELETRFDERQRDDADRDAQIELLRFQLRDLEKLGLVAGELEQLQTEHNRLANVDELVQGLQNTLLSLYEREEGSAYSLIARAANELESLSVHDASLEAQARQLAAAEIEIRDIATALSRYLDRLEPDPERLEFVESRLGKIRALARRHRVEDETLHELADTMARSLAELEGGAESLEALRQKLADAETSYFAAARRLSEARRRHARTLEHAVSAELEQLGLRDGELRISIEDRARERCDSSGIDHIEFEVRLNRGHPFAPLARVASGGELSRISLALEVVATGNTVIPTYVFDEVDAGIGGRVAEIVGNKLRALASAHQVLCVTHLPQVASQGQHHYRITKLSDGDTSRTSVRRLGDGERVEELSRMLGGVEITATTRAHAQEMISRVAK